MTEYYVIYYIDETLTKGEIIKNYKYFDTSDEAEVFKRKMKDTTDCIEATIYWNFK
tara:strand:- start:1036 stop:1203 length:168 start_codon:yes stop_codon:yes gene_type:complete